MPKPSIQLFQIIELFGIMELFPIIEQYRNLQLIRVEHWGQLPGLRPGTTKQILEHQRSLPLIELIQIIELIRIIKLIRTTEFIELIELIGIIELNHIIELIRVECRDGLCRAFGPEQ